MRKRICSALIVWGAITGVPTGFSAGVPAAYAQEESAPAPLNNFSVNPGDTSLTLRFTHERPPLRFQITPQNERAPYRLTVTFVGSRITFQPYESVPIVVAVNQRGVKQVSFSEKTEYLSRIVRSVIAVIECDRPFSFTTDSQWNGQFLELTITPEGPSPAYVGLQDRPLDITATDSLQNMQQFNELESIEAQEKLRRFSDKKRQDLSRSEVKNRLETMKKQVNDRLASDRNLETAYAKLQEDTAVSTLPLTRQSIADRTMLTDITLPGELQTAIRRSVKDTPVVSLADCLTLGMEKYTPLKIAIEQEQLAQLRVREARRGFYPSFLAEWKETDGKTVTEPYRGRSYGFQTEQPLFTGGKLTATLRKEQLGELIARGNVEKIKLDFFMNVGKAYYEVLLTKNSLDVYRRLRIRQRQLLLEIEREVSIQSATPAELLNAQSTFNQATFQLATAEQECALAKLRLEKEVFTEDLDLTNLDYRLRRVSIQTDLNECLDLAMRNRAEIKIMERTIASAEYGEDVIRSERLPNVSLIGSFGRSGEAFSVRDLNLAQEWSLMGRVRWFLGGNTLETSYKHDKVSPFRVTSTDTNLESGEYNMKMSFWDNLANFTKQKEAQISVQQAEKDLEEMRNKIRQEVEEAFYAYRKHLTQLSLAINEIGYRRKQLEIVQMKRSMAEAAVPEVMEAEQQLAEANLTLQQALAGINLSVSNLNRAIGIINYFK